MPTETTKNYRWTKVRGAPRSCARSSYRVIKAGASRLRLCCPRKAWAKHRGVPYCKVGMKLVAKGARR